MSLIKTSMQIGRNQLRNTKRFVSGRRLTVTPLSSMTLDQDDVDLAESWLLDKRHWENQEVVSKYEAEFADWNRSAQAFAFISGRVALSACIHALGLEAGDEAILPGYTCVVVPNAFHYAGINTVYSDIELNTYGLDASKLSDKITSKTRVILLQHLYGLVCRDYEAILDVADRHGLKVIEDCAHSSGATYRNVNVGNRGDVAFYSTERSKVFNTILGGMAIANDDGLIADRMNEYYHQAGIPDVEHTRKQLRNVALDYYRSKHPQRWWRADLANARYGDAELISTTKEEERGVQPAHYGKRMPAPIAALGSNQLKKVDRYNELRRRTAQRWDHWCEERGYEKPMVVEGSLPVYLRYPVLVEPEKKRDRSWAEELGVEAGIWFTSNLHPAPRPVQGCPKADEAVERCVNLPTVMPTGRQ